MVVCGSGGPTPGGESTTVWVGTVNIGRKKSAEFRANAIDKVHDAFAPIGQINLGMQEIDAADVGDEHAAVEHSFTGYSFAHFNFQDLIAVAPAWDVMHVQDVIAHPGIAHVTSPAHIVLARLKHRATGIEYIHIDSHPIAGAFTHPNQKYEAKRKQYWHMWFNKLKPLVKDHIDAGQTVLFTADANNPDLPKIHPNDRRFHHRGYDYVIGVQPDNPIVTIRSSAKKTVQINVDAQGWVDGVFHHGHAALGAKVTFSKEHGT